MSHQQWVGGTADTEKAALGLTYALNCQSANHLKVAIVSGTTANAQGGQASVTLPVEIVASKVRGIEVIVDWSGTNSWMSSSAFFAGGYQVDFYTSNGSPMTLYVNNVFGNSGNILSMPFRAVIIYEE